MLCKEWLSSVLTHGNLESLGFRWWLRDQVSLAFPEEMPELSPGGFARGEEESQAPLARVVHSGSHSCAWLRLRGTCQGEVGKETGKIRLKDLAWRGFILEGVRRLKGNRGRCAHCCCLPSRVSACVLGVGRWGWGLLFSLSGLLWLVFFIVVLKFFVYFIVIVLFLCPVCYCSSPPFLTPCLPGGVRNLLNLVRLSVWLQAIWVRLFFSNWAFIMSSLLWMLK